MSSQERDSINEIHQRLKNELHLILEEEQASMMKYPGEMMAVLTRNNGPSESNSAESTDVLRGSSAGDNTVVRESPRGAEPNASRQRSAAAAPDGGGGAGGDTCTAAAKKTTSCEDTSRN